jgi:hypothetical protein
LSEKPQRNSPFKRLRLKWKDDIKKNQKEIGHNLKGSRYCSEKETHLDHLGDQTSQGS